MNGCECMFYMVVVFLILVIVKIILFYLNEEIKGIFFKVNKYKGNF